MVAEIDKNYVSIRPYKFYTRMVGYILFEGRPVTTKGQWINPFLLGLFSALKRMPRLKKVDKPIFILGTGRSGTTILGTILSMHKEVGYLNEPKALWHKVYSGEDLIGSYSLGEARYRLDDSDVSKPVLEGAYRLYGAFLRISFSTRVVDKYPELIFRIPFVRGIFPDAKFIFLVRNGWDTCHSIGFWSERLGVNQDNVTHDWWGVNRRKWNLLLDQIISEHDDLSPFVDDMKKWTNQRDMAAVEWIVTMREGLQILERYPKEVFRINYESLCDIHSGNLDELIDFLELDNNDNVFFNYAKQRLSLTPSKGSFQLHPSIETAFTQTMHMCGYD